MDAIEAIKITLDMSESVCMKYLGDLSDADLLLRPHAECNHTNYQIGHLICYENEMITKFAPDAMPELPAGFQEKYAEENATSDDASQFATKEVLMSTYQAQREATKKLLDSQTVADLDKESGVDYAPTRGTMISMQASHWMMHCGQWVIIRRMAGKPVVI